MIDLIESKLARQEFEQRVRSLTPIHDHDARLTDDRQLTVYPIRSGVTGQADAHSERTFKRAQRLFWAITTGLSALRARVQSW